MAHTAYVGETPPVSFGSRAFSVTDALQALGSRVADFVIKQRTRYSNHRAARHLHSLDDRLLKDIGLTRSQIDAAIVLGRPLGLRRG